MPKGYPYRPDANIFYPFIRVHYGVAISHPAEQTVCWNMPILIEAASRRKYLEAGDDSACLSWGAERLASPYRVQKTGWRERQYAAGLTEGSADVGSSSRREDGRQQEQKCSLVVGKIQNAPYSRGFFRAFWMGSF